MVSMAKKILYQNRVGGKVVNIVEHPDGLVDWQPPGGLTMIDYVAGVDIGDVWDGTRFNRPTPLPPTRESVLLGKLKGDTLTLVELRELLRLERGLA